MTETEAGFQGRLLGDTKRKGLLTLYGWQWVHIKPAKLGKRWLTPVTGPLGPGWPDLFIARGTVSMFVELKTDKKYPTPQQRAVHAILRAAGHRVEIWRPRDWAEIEKELR